MTETYRLTSLARADLLAETSTALRLALESSMHAAGVTPVLVEVVEGELRGGGACPPGWALLVAQGIGFEAEADQFDAEVDAEGLTARDRADLAQLEDPEAGP